MGYVNVHEEISSYSMGALPYDTQIWVYACWSQQFNFPPGPGDYIGSYESNPVNLTRGNPDLTGINIRLKEGTTTTTTTIRPPSTTTTTLQPTTTTTSIEPECSENADCNDGLYCNGIETCVDGACERGADPCTAGEVCIEETDTCELPTRIEASTNAFGSVFLFLPGFVTIKGTGTDFTLFGSIINYEPPVLFKGVKVVNPLTQTITQFVIVLPSLLPNVPPYPATITVTVDGLSDDMEINAFPF